MTAFATFLPLHRLSHLQQLFFGMNLDLALRFVLHVLLLYVYMNEPIELDNMHILHAQGSIQRWSQTYHAQS
jgi:hypothetical protein